jgi:hypothetical protein
MSLSHSGSLATSGTIPHPYHEVGRPSPGGTAARPPYLAIPLKRPSAEAWISSFRSICEPPTGAASTLRSGAMKLQGRPTLTRALHKSGRKVYVEMTFAIVKDNGAGEVLGTVAIARDVTERVERERAASRAP